MYSEADTCRKLVTPKLLDAGWDAEPHSIAEQRSITDGRIIPVGKGFVRKAPKRVDYLLKYRRDFPMAVVEAKAINKRAADGLQQAKQYAEMLGLLFAYSTNGEEIVEFDYSTGRESRIATFPAPDELWRRWREARGIAGAESEKRLLQPSNQATGKSERYYQQIAVNRAIEAIVKDQRRILITMATGTGKTIVAFQICWKLWSSRWNRNREHRRPRILYLADRNVLIDQPMDGIFAVFGDARYKIESGKVVKSREVYFALYQALAEDERREGLFKAYSKDFFDLVIVDECHRGSARDDSSWRIILEHFAPAYQLGMTATPLRDDNRDTYLYFGNPIYQYSLRQGIEDGFLAPYRVHRVITEWDAAGWRPSKDELDRYGRPIPDEEYETKDFERVVALRARTRAIARHLTEFLKRSDRFAKTIVFCVDQEHASDMREELTNANSDLVARLPDYVCRVTSDEGDIGRGHLSRFSDVETQVPAILTTSQLLTTGIDAPTCKNIVIARVVGSMSEFKQIIGRGTRVRDDYGKLWFNIIDYTGSATRLFADPAFDGDPVLVTEEEIATGIERVIDELVVEEQDPTLGAGEDPAVIEPEPAERKKYYYDDGHVEIAAHLVYELDSEGKQLRVVRYTDYAVERVRSICPTARDLRARWSVPERRTEIIQLLQERGIGFEELAEAAHLPEADPFDLLCHLAFNAPLRTRRERAQAVRESRKEFFARFAPEARAILEELLEKYAQFGNGELALPDALKIPPISQHGQVDAIIKLFGGPEKLRAAVQQMEGYLYAS